MIASVGQVSAQAPQETQTESRKPWSRPAAMLALEAAAGRGQRERALDLVARAHAAPAGDAELVLDREVRVALVELVACAGSRASAARRRRASGRPAPARCARRAARAARRARARRPRRRRGGRSRPVSTFMPSRDDGRARGDRAGRALDADQAHAAGAERGLALVEAQRRDRRRRARGVEHRRPGRDADLGTVDLERDHLQPQLLGEVGEQAADRRGHAAAVRAQAAELQRLQQLFERSRSTALVALRTSRARAGARSGTGSTCRSSRRRRSAAGGLATARMSVSSSKATIPPWPTMQPSARERLEIEDRVELVSRGGCRRAARRSAAP